MRKSKMEELLNKLIEKGWKPRGESEPIYILSSKKLYIPDTMEVDRSLRDLVSKESGLWQFVCENGMIPKDERVSWRKIDEDGNYINHYAKYREKGSDAEYRLIETSLKNEDELEQFLLDNIKIGNYEN